jgi:hypothetical protein
MLQQYYSPSDPACPRSSRWRRARSRRIPMVRGRSGDPAGAAPSLPLPPLDLAGVEEAGLVRSSTQVRSVLLSLTHYLFSLLSPSLSSSQGWGSSGGVEVHALELAWKRPATPGSGEEEVGYARIQWRRRSGSTAKVGVRPSERRRCQIQLLG